MRNINSLYKSSLSFLEPLSLQDTYKAVIEEGKKIVDGTCGSIFLSDHGKLKKVFTTTPAKLQKPPRKNGLSYKVFLTGKPQIHTSESLKKIYPDMVAYGTKSLVLIPLIYKKKTVGMFSIHSKVSLKITKQNLTLLHILGSMAMLAIHKARLTEELKENLEARNTFIALASHELKTPLTTITIYADFLKKKIDQQIMPNQSIPTTLVSEVKRVNRLVTELLQAKTGNLSYKMSSIVMQDFVARIMKILQINFSNHRISFKTNNLSKKDLIYGDLDKLIQVITNVIQNAVKFSPPESPIDVTFTSKNEKFYVEITDFGRGIKKEDLPNIFDGFYKGQDHNKEGFGLGLFLAKKIISKHKGTISVNSTIGKGTTFTIKLPKSIL